MKILQTLFSSSNSSQQLMAWQHVQFWIFMATDLHLQEISFLLGAPNFCYSYSLSKPVIVLITCDTEILLVSHRGARTRLLSSAFSDSKVIKP